MIDRHTGAMTGRHMQIGEAAERVGLSIRTIRHYEDAGLVVPSAPLREVRRGACSACAAHHPRILVGVDVVPRIPAVAAGPATEDLPASLRTDAEHIAATAAVTAARPVLDALRHSARQHSRDYSVCVGDREAWTY
jgi:hypothetical protein